VFDDLQSRDGSSHDVGLKGVFLANMAGSFPTLDWMRPIVAPSSTVRPEALGPHSFCHIDGLHSAEGTYSDMRLCAEVVVPGGLVAVDDYFNQRFPGVSEGALLFERRHPGVLTPVAVGFNKVLFQRASESDLNERFAREFDYMPTDVTTMWGQPSHCSSPRSSRAWISTARRHTDWCLDQSPSSRCAQPSSLEWSR
jgi:hypothetical protein